MIEFQMRNQTAKRAAICRGIAKVQLAAAHFGFGASPPKRTLRTAIGMNVFNEDKGNLPLANVKMVLSIEMTCRQRDVIVLAVAALPT